MSSPSTFCVFVPARQRKALREPAHRPACRRIMVSDGQVRWEATLTRFSVQGVSLLLNTQLEPGTVLGIEWTSRSRTFSAPMLRVSRVQPRPDGTFLVECGFCHPRAFDQLYALVS